jgi:hypothetical protein
MKEAETKVLGLCRTFEIDSDLDTGTAILALNRKMRRRRFLPFLGARREFEGGIDLRGFRISRVRKFNGRSPFSVRGVFEPRNKATYIRCAIYPSPVALLALPALPLWLLVRRPIDIEIVVLVMALVVVFQVVFFSRLLSLETPKVQALLENVFRAPSSAS